MPTILSSISYLLRAGLRKSSVFLHQVLRLFLHSCRFAYWICLFFFALQKNTPKLLLLYEFDFPFLWGLWLSHGSGLSSFLTCHAAGSSAGRNGSRFRVLPFGLASAPCSGPDPPTRNPNLPLSDDILICVPARGGTSGTPQKHSAPGNPRLGFKQGKEEFYPITGVQHTPEYASPWQTRPQDFELGQKIWPKPRLHSWCPWQTSRAKWSPA